MNPSTDSEGRAGTDLAREPAGQRILNMTPDGQTGLSIAAALRHRIDVLAQAIRDKNLEKLMTLYAREVEVFDLRGSLNVPGAAGYRNNMEQWFDSFEGPLGFELRNLRITAGEGAGFCHYLALVTGARPEGRISGYWVRGTTCFERRGGDWLVVHEHISTPAV